MITNIINLPFWWQFAIWVTVPYFGAFGLYVLKNIFITNRWAKKFGLNKKNRIPIIKSLLFRGLFNEAGEWLEPSIFGLIVFSVAVIVFKKNPGVIKWGYIGSLVGLLVNSISVFPFQWSYSLRDNFILPKIVECLKKWQSTERRRLKTIPIESVLKRLADKDSISSAAIEVLNVLSATDEQFFLGYINALKIPESGWDDKHIKSAIEALGELKDERAFNPILEKLEDTKEGAKIRSAAIIALTKINPLRAFDYVLANLIDESSDIRITAVKVLGQIGDKRAIEPLLGRLADTDRKVRSAAIEVLNLFGATDAQFIQGYIAALKVPESGWRDDHIETAIEALGELKDERAFNPILEKLEGTKGRAQIRSAAIIALTKINPPRAFDYVLANLNDESSDIRITAVKVLGQIGNKRAIEPLLGRLADTDEEIRSAAIEVLNLFGATDAQFIQGYIAALKVPKSRWRDNHIEAAIEALGELRDEKAFIPILEKVEDTNEQINVRSAALMALAKIGAGDAFHYVLSKLSDSHYEIREAAIKALGELKDERAFNPILEKVEDTNEQINVRSAALMALAKIGAGEAFDYVLSKLSDSRYEIREAAIKALGELKDERAFNPILEKLEDTNEQINVRSAALMALAKINPTKAFYYVLAKIYNSSSEVRSTAATVLGQIGDKRAIPSLEELLSHTWESFYGPYGELYTNPEFKAIKDAIEMLRNVKTVMQEDFNSAPIGLNVELAKKAIKTGKIDIEEDISDSKLTDFLKLLKEINLTDIVVFGGVIKDIFFGEEINDIDISIKMQLTYEEIESFTTLDSCANERVFEHSKEILNKLAERLNFKLVDLLPPSKGKQKAFQGLDIDYFGPIKTNVGSKTVIVKRSIFDSATRRGFYSNTGAAILKIAIDADGNLYGDLQALGDLLEGKASIFGDGINFGIIDILKLLRLKHQCALTIDSAAYSLMKDRLKQYEIRQTNFPVLKIVEESIDKVITSARSTEVARKELEDLGIFTIVERARQDIIEPT